MQAITLQNLFGDNAVQTAENLIIQKSDLSAMGLTPTANNNPEQLAVAIILQALSLFEGYLTDELGNIIVNESNCPVGYANRQLYEFLEIFRWEDYIKERNNQIYLTNTIVIESYVQTIQ